MKLVPVEEVPPTWRNPKGKWVVLLEEFINSDTPAAKIALEGSSPSTVEMGIRGILRLHPFPVKVHRRRGDVYLSKLNGTKE